MELMNKGFDTEVLKRNEIFKYFLNEKVANPENIPILISLNTLDSLPV